MSRPRLAIVAIVATLAATRPSLANEPEFYRYVDETGVHIVDRLEAVPPKLRAKVERIDTNRIGLNSDLGKALDRRAEQEWIERVGAADAGAGNGNTGARPTVAASPDCAPGAPQGPMHQRAWSRYPTLIVTAIMALILLLAIPLLRKWMGDERTGRTLKWGVTILAIGGLGSHGFIRLSEGARTARNILRGKGDVCGMSDDELGRAMATMPSTPVQFKDGHDLPARPMKNGSSKVKGQ
jgi:hypothetical protein